MGHAVQSLGNGISNVVQDVVQAPTQLWNAATGSNAGGIFPNYGQQPQQQGSSGPVEPVYNMGQANTQNTISNYNGKAGNPGYGSQFNSGFQSNYGQNGQMPNQMMSGKGGNYQNTVGSGQPIMGQPNQYMNTVQGGGKGGSSQSMSQPIGGGGGKGGQPSASQNVSNGKG